MFRSLGQSLSFKQQKDAGAESDYSVEFKSGYVDPYASNSIIDTSGPLWGPGIRVQQTPSLTSQNLAHWRNYSEQPQALNAAAELDKLYASLPDDKLDLTLKDLVDARKVSPKSSPRVTPARDGDSVTIGAILGRKDPKQVRKGAAREDGGKFKPKNKVHNSPSYSLPFKLPALSPKRDKKKPSSAAAPNVSAARQSLSSHLKEHESGRSARNFDAGSSPSFPDYAASSNTIGAEIARSRSPDVHHRESRDGQYATDHLTLRQQLSHTPEDTKSSNNPQSALPQGKACCLCSASNLIFKTRCTVCGRTYCSKCVKKGMGSMRDGRKCKSTCVGRPANARFAKKSGVGCWPLFGFSNNHAKVAETTAKMGGERPAAMRYQEYEMQRKSSSYPPSRTSTHGQQASPRLSPLTSPRQSTQRVSPRPSTRQHPRHSLPTPNSP
ncbi:hypothetical protein MPTK1_7g17960 [Marchantia polymorpha subsp. ruderalis]|uniref:Uncharacterized protein n=2 Tax=Marchantia polymorpha TaxID=3197 RepID=A0AAF6C0X7_MARPO|nr:hypothetical protein MARPO_0102s0044 [Marchantia polymorpha]BBN17911.1 hypothetical protein Mp_7g17960 [Marchantia polymorpha subsp. ruderalis]|eukprot:PTQ32179.1 hypothetical protein MARPO_0102s0044 [Marchantia polymorpha]